MIKNRAQLTPKQAKSEKKKSHFANFPPGVTIPSEPRGAELARACGLAGGGGSQRYSPAAWLPAAPLLCRTTVAAPTPRSAAPAAGVGVRARGQCGGKTSAHCCRMSSTTWFWNTMVMGMLVSSVSGRSSVGPNTMATLCTDMRFCSPCSITLRWGWGGIRAQSWGEACGGGSYQARLPIPLRLPGSPAQVLEEQPHCVVVGGGQRAHQALNTAAALGLVLQLWAGEGSEAERGEGGKQRGLTSSILRGRSQPDGCLRQPSPTPTPSAPPPPGAH